MPKKKIDKKVVETQKEVKSPSKKITLQIEVNDLFYKGEAKDFKKAFEDFCSNPNYPFSIKTRTILKAGNGKKTIQQVWNVVKGRRMFKLIKLKDTARNLLAEQIISRLANE